MEWKKAKWLIIAFLLAVNLFLAFNIAVKYTKAQKILNDELSRALYLTADLPGFSEETFSSLPVYLYSYYSQRSPTAESALAKSLLKADAEPTDEGGGLTVYKNGDSSIAFRRGGNAEGHLLSFEGGQKRLSAALKSAGIKNSVIDNEIFFSYKGIDILNASLSTKTEDMFFSFSGLIPLSGGFIRNDRSLSRGELILALSGYVKEQEKGGLLNVKTSYLLSSSGIRDLELIPVITATCEKGVIIMSMTDKTLVYSGK